MKSKGNNIIQMTTAKILYNNLHSTGVTVSNAMSLQVSLEKNKVLSLKKKILQSATSQKKKKKYCSPDNKFAVWTLKEHELLYLIP